MTFLKKNYLFAKNKLFPICRSITGNGIKESLFLIKKKFPKLKIRKIKSQQKIFDWKVPPEWNVKDASITDDNGIKIVDFKINNLHLVSFSKRVNKSVTKKDLLNHLHYRKDLPNAIPYVTSYYKNYWGFCVSYNQYKKILKIYSAKSKFKINIDTNFNKKGYLNYGELILKGKTKKEILVSTYLCHPSMANNELSGPIVSMSLINFFSKKKINKTIRFLFIPETIGSIAFINKNLDYLKKWCIGGYNLTCIGDERNHSCLLSKNEDSPSDKCLLDAYKVLKINFKTYPFLMRGSDERQYNSPHVDLGITSIFRTKYGEYKEYHSSYDNFDLVTLKGVKGGYNVARTAINKLQKSIIPETKLICEPKLSKRNMYNSISKINYRTNKSNLSKKILNFIQYSNGKNRIEDISNIIKLSLVETKSIYKLLKKKNLLSK
ncbi:DUF4910 domain-containing protein [Candidatus Pelagibacter sp.]|nr:DUF4910 domain-containing protein [Candidatus Pelagibacter sp.]